MKPNGKSPVLLPGKLYQHRGGFCLYAYAQLKWDEYGHVSARRHVGNLNKGAIVLVLETFDSDFDTQKFAYVLTPEFGKVFIVIAPGWEECKS